VEYVFRRSYRGPLKAIILDWAGTTMDYGCYAPAVVFVEVYRRQGVPITNIQKILALESVAQRWEAAHGRKPTGQDVEVMFQEFVPRQLACLPDYADLIPGALEAASDFRRRGMKIGSTTGYTREMMELVVGEARQRGYEPDSSVCATDVPAGRPEPWMCLQNAMNLRVYPMEAVVKVDDTLPGIEEGLNAGMWTVGLARTGNEIGLNEEEISALAPDVLQVRLDRAYNRMHQAGAHYVVDGIWDVPAILDAINARLAGGEKP